MRLTRDSLAIGETGAVCRTLRQNTKKRSNNNFGRQQRDQKRAHKTRIGSLNARQERERFVRVCVSVCCAISRCRSKAISISRARFPYFTGSSVDFIATVARNVSARSISPSRVSPCKSTAACYPGRGNWILTLHTLYRRIVEFSRVMMLFRSTGERIQYMQYASVLLCSDALVGSIAPVDPARQLCVSPGIKTRADPKTIYRPLQRERERGRRISERNPLEIASGRDPIKERGQRRNPGQLGPHQMRNVRPSGRAIHRAPVYLTWDVPGRPTGPRIDSRKLFALFKEAANSNDGRR